MPCTSCGSDKVFARGYCGGCYNRLRRTGSVKRTYVINSGKCLAEGCTKDAFAKNLCLYHYQKAQHPLKATWKILRNRSPDQYPVAWDDFDKFISDVGERPTPRHKLKRIDAGKPYSKSNIHWLRPVSTKDYMSRDQRSAYSREWTLQRRFKITTARYNEMLAAQGGVCAICGTKETHTYKSGKLKELSVDHCHDSKKVRGLLCAKCNRAIGYFDDSIERLRRAIAYLEKYKI